MYVPQWLCVRARPHPPAPAPASILGRTVGLAFVLPAAYFWAKGRIMPKYRGAIVGIGALIGVQGLIGWLMVKSGLDVRARGVA